MKLALAQLAIEDGAIDANRERAVDAVAEAAAAGADLVALPEIVTAGYFAFDAYERAAEPVEGPTIEALRPAAIEHEVAVLAGTIVEDLAATASVETPAESGLANTAVLLDADGAIQLVYRKHHLFGYDSREAELLVPGERLDTASVQGIDVGVTTCYDLRFPELYRDLLEQGVELILVPSAWPEPRVEHWQTLPRARAIENQLYVAAVNGAAVDRDGPSLLGRSTVFDPWGTPISASGPEPAIVTATVDPDRVAEVREDFPALDDRRV
ncbi:nitrilase-related carbon-nitrogen hydrolase [Salinarchaeum sp. Harcht-Bsk1]|uniref:nitrilase-related carbon-nitrogen hydrolase n=1 Tax=Salinarchaeum sp. Harcht-Bsk1 TaxID=1333523 RepID=UPI0006777A07|nr:nitrilase-related carbon-nitrogen hydrolase [Salinarchaeum sp. Harcht-Bsk1]